MSMKLLARLLLIAALPLAIGPAAAQNYPAKPIKILTGFQPGGPTDIIARVIGDHMTRAWSQPVIVEARPGAAGNLAAELTARAPADGYTLHVGSAVLATMFNALYEKLSYNPDKDLVAIALLTRTPQVLAASGQTPVKNYHEFVDYLKKEGGKLGFGSPGIGTLPHMTAELFRMKIGAESVHVPYRGSAPFMDAFLKNEVQWSVDVLGGALRHKDKIRILAVTSNDRLPELPDTPSFVELGLPELETYSAFILYGPASLPKAMVKTVSDEMGRGLRDPQLVDRLKNVGYYAAPMSTEDVARFIDAERARWIPVIKANSIKVE